MCTWRVALNFKALKSHCIHFDKFKLRKKMRNVGSEIAIARVSKTIGKNNENSDKDKSMNLERKGWFN